jgi:hypothetical protein
MKKLLAILVLGLLWCNVVQALPKCEGEWNKKWTNCFGKQITWSSNPLKKNAIYVGEFKNGEHNGQGIITFFNGEQYNGEFKNGNYHGQGTYIWANGKIYSGEYNNDVWSGFATFMTTPEIYYSGYFKNNFMDGKGAVHINQKGSFVGELKEGKRIKEGPVPNNILTYCPGEDYKKWIDCYVEVELETVSYYGRFDNQHFNGLGASITKNDKYFGELKNGQREGFGTVTWTGVNKKSSGTYTGEFKNNLFNGWGVIQYGDGFIYTGTFVDDKQHGDGICFSNKFKGVAMDCKMDNNIWINE